MGFQRDVVYLGWPTAPSYVSKNAGEEGELPGLSRWIQLYTGAQINFGDLTLWQLPILLLMRRQTRLTSASVSSAQLRTHTGIQRLKRIGFVDSDTLSIEKKKKSTVEISVEISVNISHVSGSLYPSFWNTDTATGDQLIMDPDPTWKYLWQTGSKLLNIIKFWTYFLNFFKFLINMKGPCPDP